MKQTKAYWTNDKIEDYLIELLIKNCYEVLQLTLHNYKKIKSESPDFIISSKNKKIGIEITRALDQNLQKVYSIRNNEFSHISFCPTLFENKDMSKKDIIGLLQKSEKQLIGKSYVDNELEEKVFNNIKKSIVKKNEKFMNYNKFNKNILFIHAENRVTLDIELVVQKISSFISNISLLYDCVFLKLGDYIFYFRENSYERCKIKT